MSSRSKTLVELRAWLETVGDVLSHGETPGFSDVGSLYQLALGRADDLEVEGGRDHKAMETLRSASLKKGWKWQWDGMDLQQVTLGPNAPNTHKDPADAALDMRKWKEGESR